MRDTKQWRRTDRHGYPSCDMCHEAADIIDALRAERNALLIALQTADRTFAGNGLLACHAARKEIRAAIDAAMKEQL